MKRELRESQAQTDCLELSLIHARQDLKCRTQAADAQQALMAARIQDLALKLSAAEKQVLIIQFVYCYFVFLLIFYTLLLRFIMIKFLLHFSQKQ